VNYVFDTSALIGPWSRTYPPDLFPSFWERMDGLATTSRILVPEEVVAELARKDDDLCGWVRARAAKMVAPTTRPLMLTVREVLASHRHLMKTGTSRNQADSFVIGLAVIDPRTVVTEEGLGSAKKPTIPYIWRHRDIDCITPLDFIRAEGWQF